MFILGLLSYAAEEVTPWNIKDNAAHFLSLGSVTSQALGVSLPCLLAADPSQYMNLTVDVHGEAF